MTLLVDNEWDDLQGRIHPLNPLLGWHNIAEGQPLILLQFHIPVEQAAGRGGVGEFILKQLGVQFAVDRTTWNYQWGFLRVGGTICRLFRLLKIIGFRRYLRRISRRRGCRLLGWLAARTRARGTGSGATRAHGTSGAGSTRAGTGAICWGAGRIPPTRRSNGGAGGVCLLRVTRLRCQSQRHDGA